MKTLLLCTVLIAGPAFADVCDPHDWRYLRTRITDDLLNIYCAAIKARDTGTISYAKCEEEIKRIRYLMVKYQGFNGSSDESKQLCKHR